MDLNHLYHQHQVSTMRAAAAPSRLARTQHLAAAGSFASRIRNYQIALGAEASAGWPAAKATGCAQT
ncbi:hypothetical protein [Novosphingobium sp.]|uniref:hypothetical protein n=1 Tax=Novosphingobium sp. TaxID=1874826 RepID=UPI00286E2F88|nr:hypothetical protein [Novosphingobium sp.]